MINRKPERVRIKTINTATTLDQALRTYKVPTTRLEELAILNGMKLTDRITPGTMIKVIER
jgi:predicted Zn-dependent protease